jgi:hypothetical protein
MREWLFNQPGAESDRCIEGLKTIAENVLSHSGYGQVRPWKSSEEHKKTETLLANMTFFEAVGALVSNLILSAAVPMSVLTLPFLPRTFRRTGEAAKQYARLASELLGHEKELEAKNNAPRDNFAAMLNRVAASGSEEEKSHQLLLTDDEIRGNLYIFSAAGFETTANNMAFALALLAAYPKWQTWIQDELDEVFADVSDSDLGDYEKIFPRLQRCLAVMVSRPRRIYAALLVKSLTGLVLVRNASAVSTNCALAPIGGRAADSDHEQRHS